MRINLLTEAKIRALKIQKLNWSITLVTILVGTALVITISVIFSIRFSNQNKLNDLEDRRNNLQTEIGKLSSLQEKVVTIQNKTTEIERIFNEKNQWPKLLAEIEKAIPKEAKAKSLSVEANKVSVSFEASSLYNVAKTLESFRKYTIKKNNLEQKLFPNVVLESFGYNEVGGTTFNLTFEFQKELLWP